MDGGCDHPEDQPTVWLSVLTSATPSSLTSFHRFADVVVVV